MPKETKTTAAVETPKTTGGKFKLNPMVLIPALAAGAFLLYSNTTKAAKKQTPTVTTWPTASAISQGQALSASSLSGGTISVPGSFVWTTPTTIPTAGSTSESVTFMPTDSTTYASVIGQAVIEVNVGTPNVVTGLQNNGANTSPVVTGTNGLPTTTPTTTSYNYTVKGSVNKASYGNVTGVPFPGVTVTLSDGAAVSLSTTTDSSGNYSFAFTSQKSTENLNGAFTMAGYGSQGVEFQATAANPNINVAATALWSNTSSSAGSTSGTITTSTISSTTPPPASNPNIISSGIVTVNSSNGVNVRSAPNTTASLAGSEFLPYNTQFEVVGYVVGQNVSGNSYWWVSSMGNYVSCIGTQQQPDTSVAAQAYTAPSGVTTSTSGLASVETSTSNYLSVSGTGANTASTTTGAPTLVVTPTPVSTSSSASSSFTPRSVTVNVAVLYVRSSPSSTAPLAGSQELYNGDTFIANNWVTGESVSGENRWWVSQYGNYIWVGGTTQKP